VDKEVKKGISRTKATINYCPNPNTTRWR